MERPRPEHTLHPRRIRHCRYSDAATPAVLFSADIRGLEKQPLEKFQMDCKTVVISEAGRRAHHARLVYTIRSPTDFMHTNTYYIYTYYIVRITPLRGNETPISMSPGLLLSSIPLPSSVTRHWYTIFTLFEIKTPQPKPVAGRHCAYPPPHPPFCRSSALRDLLFPQRVRIYV